MILNRLSIINYKNIQEATLTLSPKMNCFIGPNGTGKTNLLDAVYYLSFCRSAYTSVDSQVIRHDQDFFVVEGDYTDDRGMQGDNQDELRKLSIYCGMISSATRRNISGCRSISD